jgi:hypothetical protein
MERKHTCSVCTKRFTRSDLLRRHVRLHAPESESAAVQPTNNLLDALAPNAPQPIPTALDSSSIHAAEVSLLEWPPWDHADLLSCDQIPEDILLDAASWQSFLHSDSTYGFTTWGISDASQVADNAATQDVAPEAFSPSAAPSPPNETSREDQTPFAWDPASKRISHVGEVVFDLDDPLLSDVEPRFALSPERYLHLKTVLSQDIVTNDTIVIDGMPSIPCVEVLNAFLSHFVRFFLPQAPVLHCPTFEINGNCPDHLLMIMIAIGAMYCKRRHVRRFAIVLQDLARCHLHMAVNANDLLLKDPDTVYSSALIYYAGIWCGNKRAFELAEALRGSVVAWIRRLSNQKPVVEDSQVCERGAWLNWARNEQLKRLRWTVYMFDCQTSSLTNTAPNMSLSEVFDWDCPCDDEYWAASTARQCKLLLGSAIVPPSKSFAAALGPFLLESPNLRPLKKLNEFGAFLVLLSINMKIFRYTDERDMLMKLSHMALDGSQHTSESHAPPIHDSEERKQLASMYQRETRTQTMPALIKCCRITRPLGADLWMPYTDRTAQWVIFPSGWSSHGRVLSTTDANFNIRPPGDHRKIWSVRVRGSQIQVLNVVCSQCAALSRSRQYLDQSSRTI